MVGGEKLRNGFAPAFTRRPIPWLPTIVTPLNVCVPAVMATPTPALPVTCTLVVIQLGLVAVTAAFASARPVPAEPRITVCSIVQEHATVMAPCVNEPAGCAGVSVVSTTT